MSNRDYHTVDGLSKSKMDKLLISPEHYKASLCEPEKQTEALIFGSLFHTIVLEPNKIKTEYAIEPIVNKRTNDGKDILRQFYEENASKTIITQEQLDLAIKLKDKIMQHSIAKKLLKTQGDTEISLFWNDTESGILLKARPDKLVNDIIIDIKTTNNANPNEFYKNAYKYGYHRQAYHFMKGFENCYGKKASGFIFIAIEKDPPYAVCVYKASDDFIKIGGIETKYCIEKYSECEKNNIWQGYEEKIHELDLPIWIKK